MRPLKPYWKAGDRMKLSKRERFLISLLFVVIIWVTAFKISIGPSYSDYVNNKQLIGDLEVQKDQMDMYLMLLPDLESQRQKKPEAGREEILYQDIDDVFMDRNLQAIAADSGSFIRRMSIKDSEPVDPLVDQEGSPLETNGIMKRNITMELTCEEPWSVMEFADQIRREPKSLVLSYMDMQAEYGSGEDGTEVYKGMKGIVEVVYYYEETD